MNYLLDEEIPINPLSPISTATSLTKKKDDVENCIKLRNMKGKKRYVDIENIEQYIKNEKPALVLFYADWCGHCNKLKPTWETAVESAKEKGLTMIKINVGGNDSDSEETKMKNAEISKKYNIDGYPTIILFKNGKPTPYEGPRTVDGFINAFN
jgi:thiol-disulfide isomerase/thioredoxin